MVKDSLVLVELVEEKSSLMVLEGLRLLLELVVEPMLREQVGPVVAKSCQKVPMGGYLLLE